MAGFNFIGNDVLPARALELIDLMCFILLGKTWCIVWAQRSSCFFFLAKRTKNAISSLCQDWRVTHINDKPSWNKVIKFELIESGYLHQSAKDPQSRQIDNLPKHKLKFAFFVAASNDNSICANQSRVEFVRGQFSVIYTWYNVVRLMRFCWGLL